MNYDIPTVSKAVPCFNGRLRDFKDEITDRPLHQLTFEEIKTARSLLIPLSLPPKG